MTTIENIYFPDSEFTLKQVQNILKEKAKQKPKELRFTLIVPNIKQSKRRVIQLKKKNNKDDKRDWRHKYPPCPDCGAIGYKGMTTTRLGSLRCRSCNSMFEKKQDKFYNILVGKSMGD